MGIRFRKIRRLLLGKSYGEFKSAIFDIHNSVCAVMRIHRIPNGTPSQAPQFQVSLAGTAWCIAKNRYFLTAHHIFNDRNPRDPNDRFYIFSVPDNGPQAFHYPVVAFPLENQQIDMAVLDVQLLQGINFKSIPVTFDHQNDGSQVLTYGFPSPTIGAAQVNLDGSWAGGQFFLKGHANEGIVAGNFEMNDNSMYEFNVGWHHGESGGPILSLKSGAGFSIMQTYRPIQLPNGTIMGPHQGVSLRAIEADLRRFGAIII